MAAPAMVNTSEFNLTLTRVQLLKSQVPAGIAPPDTQHIEIRNAEVSGYHTQGQGCPKNRFMRRSIFQPICSAILRLRVAVITLFGLM